MVRLKNSGCGTIEQSIDAPDSETYRILYDGRKVGGVVLKINKETHHTAK